MKTNLPKKLQEKIERVQKSSLEREAEIERRRAARAVHTSSGKAVKKKA